MKKIIRIVILFVTCVAFAVPVAEAQRHQGANNSAGSRREHTVQSASPSQRKEQPSRKASRSLNGSSLNTERVKNNRAQQYTRPSIPASFNNNVNNAGSRPSVGTGSRPSVGQGNNNGNNNRPGISNNRPGNGNSGNNRPGVGVTNNRPGNNPNPGINNRPGNPGGNPGMSSGLRPGIGQGQGPVNTRPATVRPPQRPNRPAMVRPNSRPVPPPYWRPRRGLPVIGGILGLTFGAAINISLDYLYNNGYSVDGYGNNVVYLRNVPVLNYMWTDGALYYGASGLDASCFYYYTPAYDPARYNNVYNSLVRTYGYPVSTNNSGGVMSSTWFGGNNGYITLSFGSSDGQFLTTLTMGM